jgi:hypothetical protein
MLEVIGPVNDAGELIGAGDAPARLAGSQQSIVAHAESLNGIDSSARTSRCVYHITGGGRVRPGWASLAG